MVIALNLPFSSLAELLHTEELEAALLSACVLYEHCILLDYPPANHPTNLFARRDRKGFYLYRLYRYADALNTEWRIRKTREKLGHPLEGVLRRVVQPDHDDYPYFKFRQENSNNEPRIAWPEPTVVSFAAYLLRKRPEYYGCRVPKPTMIHMRPVEFCKPVEVKACLHQ